MSKQTEAVVRSIFEDVFNRGDHSLVSRLYTEDLIGFDPAYPGELKIEHLLQLLSIYREAFPDLHYTVEDVICEGDRAAAVRWTATGTQRGAMPGFPATGRKVNISGISICHFKDGRVNRVWQSWDNLGFFKQLGHNPNSIEV
jgi:steroid delta-isomerase-like uncharacterized protein